MTDLTTSIDQEEARLIASKDDAFKSAKRRPTTANMRTYKKAEKALADFLKARHEPEETSFSNVLKVVEYLDGEGWKVKKSSAYEHVDDGKLAPQKNGTFALSAVLEYAGLHLQKKDGSTVDGEDLQRQKVVAEIRRIGSDADMRDLKLRQLMGELVPKADVERQLAERAADLKSYLDNVARTASTRIIKLVGGDPQKAPELIAFQLGVNRKAMDNYSRPLQDSDVDED
jgi:hypothetical protein